MSPAFVFPNRRCKRDSGGCWKTKCLEHWCWGAAAGIGFQTGVKPDIQLLFEIQYFGPRKCKR